MARSSDRRRAALLFLLSMPAPLAAQATRPASRPGTIPIEALLVLETGGRRGRVPVFADPVLSALAKGTWQAPEAGARAGERSWRKITADKDGWFADRALRGSGWAFAAVESAEERVMLLDASGDTFALVNGEPRGGDPYAEGAQARLPVLLRKGSNEFLFRGSRGRLRATLVEPRTPVFLEPRDAVLPDVVVGATWDLFGSVAITNATAEWCDGVGLGGDRVQAEPPGRRVTRPTVVDIVPPMSAQKRPFVIARRAESRPDTRPASRVAIDVELRQRQTVLDRWTPELMVRQPGERHVQTFQSEVDGSVQRFAVVPPAPLPPAPLPAGSRPASRPGIVLTLHGAGVDANGQAACYAPRDWAWIVAPTNRRPFGFDWEDWGRMDAMEVLRTAVQRLEPGPGRWLTGHSMGGHGTWSLGAHFPGLFHAIAPSAGWRDFASYGGGVDWGTGTPVRAAFDRAANTYRTLLLEDNWRESGVYILHGDRDDNVPVAQARFMKQELQAWHPDLAYHEQPGAGHWWGNECMDWPPLMAFLRAHGPPDPSPPRRVKFTTVNPGISASCHWVTVLAQVRSLEPSTVEAAVDPTTRVVTATTRNVAMLQLHPPAVPDVERRTEYLVDGQRIAFTLRDPDAPGWVILRRDQGGSWKEAVIANTGKSPFAHGPFKEAFRHRFVLVVGTAGTPEENAWALAKARYDAEVFQARGNASPPIVRDTDVLARPSAFGRRNLILYGNADTHRLWATALGDCPLQVRRGRVAVGGREFTGDDLACLFVFPRANTFECVAVVAGTGLVGMRATNHLPYFTSGVPFPDWVVLGADVWDQGIDGVRAAGFFTADWKLE